MPLSLQEIMDARNWMNQQWGGNNQWQWNGDYQWGANEQADRALMGMTQAHGYDYNDIASMLGYGNMGPVDSNPIKQSWDQFVGSRTGNAATNQYAIDRGFITSANLPNSNASSYSYDRGLDQSGFNSPFKFNSNVNPSANGAALSPQQKLNFLRERLGTANRPGMQNRIQGQINRLSGVQPNHGIPNTPVQPNPQNFMNNQFGNGNIKPQVFGQPGGRNFGRT